jgi:Spy/CpxP family protein refolding chaperone
MGTLRQVVGVGLLVTLVAASASAQQGRRGFGFFGGGFGAGGNLLTLATNEAVQKELGIGADVAAKLNSLRDDYQAAIRKEYQTAGIDFQSLQNLSADERQKLMTKMAEINTKLNEEFTPQLAKLLSADQISRLKQIQIQAQGGTALTANPEVAKALNLSEEQRRKLSDLQAEFARRQRELFASGDPQERFAKMRELNRERDAKMLEVLTEEQRQQFTALKGDPFDVSQLGFGGRGRRGNN